MTTPIDDTADPEQPPDQPLGNRTIVVTRSEDRKEGLTGNLRELGASVILVPTIRFAPPADPGPLLCAIDELDRFRWFLFTSATGVSFFFQALEDRGIAPERLQGRCFAVVGPATASALGEYKLRAERIAAFGDARSLAEALLAPETQAPLGANDPCLLPQADIARPYLAEALLKAGVPVSTVTAYRTITEEVEKAEPFLKALEGDDQIDGIAFASPSAVKSFLAMTDPHGKHAILEKPIRVFSIGPTTSEAIRERGLQVARQAFPHTSEALVQIILETLGS